MLPAVVGMASPRWLNDDQQRTWRAFLEASQRLYDELDRELLRDVGMPLAYYQILAMLSEAPQRTLRMSELADRTWSSRSRLSHAVDRLEDRGWVIRSSCPSDKRGSFAVLTDAGMTVLEAAAPSHVESVRRHVFDLLSAEQVDQLGAIARTIAVSLSGACAAELSEERVG
jgi:DNA-binding MarR family transcriptional regulator